MEFSKDSRTRINPIRTLSLQSDRNSPIARWGLCPLSLGLDMGLIFSLTKRVRLKWNHVTLQVGHKKYSFTLFLSTFSLGTQWPWCGETQTHLLREITSRGSYGETLKLPASSLHQPPVRWEGESSNDSSLNLWVQRRSFQTSPSRDKSFLLCPFWIPDAQNSWA